MALPPDLLARLDAAVALYGAGEPATRAQLEEAVRGLGVAQNVPDLAPPEGDR